MGTNTIKAGLIAISMTLSLVMSSQVGITIDTTIPKDASIAFSLIDVRHQDKQDGLKSNKGIAWTFSNLSVEILHTSPGRQVTGPDRADVSPVIKLPESTGTLRHYGVFCRMENSVDPGRRFRPVFRLGSADYVDMLEGKTFE